MSVRHSGPPSPETSRFIVWGDRRCSLMSSCRSVTDGPGTSANRLPYKHFSSCNHPSAQEITMCFSHGAGAFGSDFAAKRDETPSCLDAGRCPVPHAQNEHYQANLRLLRV